MKLLSLLLILLTATVYTACAGAAESSLVGSYASKENGNPEIKITKDGEKYFVSIYSDESWSKPQELHSGTKENLKELFGKDADRIKSSLITTQNGSFGIFLVTPGEIYADIKAPTAYLVYIFMGSGPAWKVTGK